MRVFPFRRPADPAVPRADLTICQSCGSDFVIPAEWAEQDATSWWIRLRCGQCRSGREVVVPDAAAERYDQRLQQGMDEIARALQRQELEQMARDAETFATALELDLVDPGDFVG